MKRGWVGRLVRGYRWVSGDGKRVMDRKVIVRGDGSGWGEVKPLVEIVWGGWVGR